MVGTRVAVAAAVAVAGLTPAAGLARAGAAPASGQVPAVWAPTTPLPVALRGLAAAATGSQIFVTGGTTTSPGAQVSAATWAFTPATAAWAPKASLPEPRTGLALASTGGFLYAIGGVDTSGDPISAVDRYTPATDSWAAVAPMPVALNQPATTVGPDGHIYVLFSGTGGLQAESYNPSNNSWSLTKAAPGGLPYPLMAAAAGSDGELYAFSSGDGCCNNGDLGGGGFAYTPSTNTWHLLPELTALPGNLWWGSWASARRDARGRIVLVGGWGSCAAGGCGQPYGSLSIFDPSSGRWSFGFDAPAEAEMPATVMFGTTLYSIGGALGGPGQATSEVDVLPLSDAQPPTVQTPPGMTISPTGALYTTSVPIHVVNHAVDRSGIAGVHLQRSANGSPFVDGTYPWSQADTIVRPSVGFVYREQYVDGAGNLSPWANGPSFHASVLQEGFSGIKYTGTWARTPVTSALGGSTRSTSSPGATATLSFSGRSVRFVGASTAQSGFAEIIVDDVLQGIYSFATGAANSIPLAYSWPDSGKHTMQIVDVKGGPGLRIDVDAFAVLS